MSVSANRGSWTGTSTVDVPPGSEIALVDAQDIVVCQGMVSASR
jgi:hypothetical protein